MKASERKGIEVVMILYLLYNHVFYDIGLIPGGQRL